MAIDIARPFPVTKRNNKYILIVADYFIKSLEVFTNPNQEASTVVLIDNAVCRCGVPLELLSEQGRNFESTLFQEMFKVSGIQKTRTTPFYPQSHGMLERFIRTY
ncbi:hypothetical protein Trydic_g2536 [Trypoxylus dichotomus]